MIIGYLTSDLFTSYNCTIWNGIRDVCSEHHASFLYFSGGQLRAPDTNQSSRNLIYDLVSSRNVDGILINSATIFHFVSTSEAERFYEKFSRIPIVSIGVKVKNRPAVITNNEIGIRDAVVHLIERHNYRKIAFISGPKNNYESNIRFNTYKQVLDDYGIPFSPSLLAVGTYHVQSGAEGLNKLLAQNTSLDAVVTANDDMAIGVMNQAQSLGIVIPNELAICGFDDIPEAPLLSVPLTTVRQPILRQAQTACRLLIDGISGGDHRDDIVLPTEFVQRRTCGCFSDATKRAGYVPSASVRETPVRDIKGCIRNLKEDRGEILASLELICPEARVSGGPADEAIFDSLVHYLESTGAEAPLFDVDRIFNKSFINNFTDFSFWQNLISELISKTKPYYLDCPTCFDAAQSFWQQLRVLLQETSSCSQSFTKMKTDFHAAMVRKISGQLLRSFEMKRLLDTIKYELPKIDIQACYLCLYDPSPERYEAARLILAYNEDGVIDLPEAGIPFKTRDLIPRDILSFDEPDAFIVEALFFEGEHFGYIFFKTNPKKVIFEELRQQISSALKGAILTEEVRGLAVEQEKHAKELQKAYDSLKKNQEKMLLNEKMASLGRLTAGIAHEMNTPLATVRLSVKELQALINEYRESVGDDEVTVQDHQAIADDMYKSTELIRKSAERAVGFVQSVKSQTRDLKSTDRHHFNAIPVIQEAILLLNHTIRKNNCPVEINFTSDRIMLYGVEGRLAQVVTNLIVNAIDASRDKGGCPVTLTMGHEDGRVVLKVSDSGGGISENILSKIFDPLFSTKSLAEGTGLGLTIVHDIVYGDFGGTIEVESVVGEGTVFAVAFPESHKGGRDAKKV